MNRKDKLIMLLWGILAALIVVSDQISKFLVVKNISPTDTIHVINGIIDFVYVKNTGGAFSILNNATWLLTIISVIFCIGVIVYFIKEKPEKKVIVLALSLMFSGALGNALDRMFRGFVVDFIKTEFVDFPVFNIADIAITVGAVILIVYMIFFDNVKKENAGE